MRGAQKKGQHVHLLRVVTHTSGVVLGQESVGEKTNEIPIARHLVTQVELKDRVVTADALHTHHATIDVILRQQGHYLLVAKDNQPELVQALRDWFAEPAWREDDEEQVTTAEQGHGRDERRTLITRCLPQGMAGWPSVRQALRRVTWRCSHRTGKIEEDVTYAITDIPRSQATAARLEQYWRGHWGIENRVHYVRDVLWREDANHCAQGATAQALAALRNGLLSLLRLVPVRSSIAASLRFFASDPFAAFSRFLPDFANALARLLSDFLAHPLGRNGCGIGFDLHHSRDCALGMVSRFKAAYLRARAAGGSPLPTE